MRHYAVASELFFFVLLLRHAIYFVFFFFNDTATTEIYTLSLHDALPISICGNPAKCFTRRKRSSSKAAMSWPSRMSTADRKSTRLNSSHGYISYAVFCLKKKKKQQQ